MATVNGSQILARTLRKLEIDTMFYLMGGPMLAAESACIEEGIRSIDVRHEQAAAMMAHAYGRVLNKIGVCMAASGPATMNLVTGVANAWSDRAPLLAVGGASPVSQFGMDAFQEMDQVSVFKPITKWAQRAHDPRRVPELWRRPSERRSTAALVRSIWICRAMCCTATWMRTASPIRSPAR